MVSARSRRWESLRCLRISKNRCYMIVIIVIDIHTIL